MQQLKIMEHFIRKNHFKTKVVHCKTIREKNGVACSSRNFLLSIKEKNIASEIYKLLIHKKKNLLENKLSLKMLEEKILKLGATKIDYLQINL